MKISEWLRAFDGNDGVWAMGMIVFGLVATFRTREVKWKLMSALATISMAIHYRSCLNAAWWIAIGGGLTQSLLFAASAENENQNAER